MTLNLWLAYVGLLLAVCLTPGPAVILATAEAAARGTSAAIPVIAGIQVGNLFYFILSAIGVGALIAASETAFQLIKYVGAAYLLVLGVRALMGGRSPAGASAHDRTGPRAFVHGLASQLANPKSVLFYAAMLPQFIVPKSDHLLRDLALMALTGIAVEVPILLGYAALAARGSSYVLLRGSAWRERLTGSALIAAAAGILLTRRTT